MQMYYTLWAYLTEALVKGSYKRLSLTEKPQYVSHVITHYRYVFVTERYTETLHVKKMADLNAVYKFIPYTRVNKCIHLFPKLQGNMPLLPNMRLIMKAKIDHTLKPRRLFGTTCT